MSKKKDSFKPWLRRPAVNRSVTIPVTGPLTQPLTGFGGTFDPLALNPYAFFDGESYKGTLENPTLDLDPSNPDSLDVITATRAGSTATYTDSSGIIQVASPDTVRVDYVQGEQLTPTKFQLVPHTDFSTAHWAHLNGTVVTTDTTLSPDGATAKKFSAGNGVSSSSVRSIISTPTTSNTYTLSWYAKAGGFDESMVRIDAGGSTIKGSVNLLTGAVTLQTGSALDSISSEAVSGGWFRISMTMSLSGAGGSIMSRFYPTYSNGYIGDGSSGVYLAQPQVEEGTTASSFVANTTGSPKFITGATYGPRVPMILVEPSATNLLTQTDFSAGWATASGLAIEQTTDSTPLSSQTALRLTSTQISSRYQAPSAYPSGSSTASVYIKWDGVDTRFGIYRGLSNSEVLFNVTQGGVTHHSNNSDGYSIEEHGDGWWRVSNTMANPTWFQLYADIEDGDGSILVALPQHEAGSVATSYIPTSGGDAAARTRAKDDLVISGSDFDFYNQSEGTFYIEDIPRITNSTQIARFSLNDGTNVTSMYSLVSGAYDLLVKANGSANSYNVGGTTIVPNQLERVAFSYITDEIKVSRDGALNNPANNPSTQAIPVVDRLHLGQIDGFTRNLNGRIRRLIFWPYSSENL